MSSPQLCGQLCSLVLLQSLPAAALDPWSPAARGSRAYLEQRAFKRAYSRVARGTQEVWEACGESHPRPLSRLLGHAHAEWAQPLVGQARAWRAPRERRVKSAKSAAQIAKVGLPRVRPLDLVHRDSSTVDVGVWGRAWHRVASHCLNVSIPDLRRGRDPS